MTTLADIAIPRRLKSRPVWHGMVVPITAQLDAKGTPDFAVINEAVASRLVEQRGCALCGSRMRGRFAFLGGTGSMESRTFRDGPMHEECARYAMAVCPFVSGKHREYREATARAHDATVVQVPMGPATPMGLLVASDYEILGPLLMHAGEPVQPIEWVDA